MVNISVDSVKCHEIIVSCACTSGRTDKESTNWCWYVVGEIYQKADTLGRWEDNINVEVRKMDFMM